MAKMQLTYVVAWTNAHGHEVRTEVVVRADNNADGRMLADQAAQRVIGAEARLVPGNKRIFTVDEAPRRIEA
ncbi:hypothetical protein [Microbacterium maritypicum]|uniref:Uncharacterized protein n=1 Tax=Microbacterium maritypicum TaxID=33918 RepID=A0A4Y4B7X2_MICMQ|nr:hypothetical protein [Microbacterium liquefaciens]GEC76705.1 hypothetical protein MLI01_28500 [Microbacterium liquefaciens]GGV61926.1 hypothetical protein GCM10010213_25980 [Microbacterium liquefaciens]